MTDLDLWAAQQELVRLLEEVSPEHRELVEAILNAAMDLDQKARGK